MDKDEYFRQQHFTAMELFEPDEDLEIYEEKYWEWSLNYLRADAFYMLNTRFFPGKLSSIDSVWQLVSLFDADSYELLSYYKYAPVPEAVRINLAFLINMPVDEVSVLTERVLRGLNEDAYTSGYFFRATADRPTIGRSVNLPEDRFDTSRTKLNMFADWNFVF